MDQRKRYQIFVSSTFADLEEERGKVMETILTFDCFPAGMEMFPAMDEEQFEYIKRIIDDSDYYLLIIGGRYGSVDDNGISWTEKEFDYAITQGIPVLVFDHKDYKQLPVNKTDQNVVKQKKLDAFKKRVAIGRLIAKWNNADDLALAVAKNLSIVINTFPRIGWVRSNTIASDYSLNEINRLQNRIKELENLQKVDQDWENSYTDQEKIQQHEKINESKDAQKKNDYSCVLTVDNIQKMFTEALRNLVQSALQQEMKKDNIPVHSDETQIEQTESPKNNKIYICYRHNGSNCGNHDEDVASELYDALVTAGYDCWMLSRNLEDVIVNKCVQEVIPNAIHDCNLFIIVLSKDSFIVDEYFDLIFTAVFTATNDGKIIKPFRIDAIKKKDQTDPLMTYLERCEFMEIDASEDYLQKKSDLIDYVKRKLGN